MDFTNSITCGVYVCVCVCVGGGGWGGGGGGGGEGVVGLLIRSEENTS